MDGEPAFHRLSEELLTIIADSYFEIFSLDSRAQELLRLRLIHPKFANLSQVLSKGFREVKLVASRHGVELIRSTGLSKISPYVQQVTFLPDTHSWFLGLVVFREIIITQAIHKFAIEQGIHHFLACNRGPGHPIENWNHDPPIMESELTEGYKRYRRRAAQAARLLESGQVQSAWVSAIANLPKAHIFKLGVRDYARSKINSAANYPSLLDCEVVPWHSHDSQHKKQSCQDAASPIGDMLARIVAGSLNEAKRPPGELIFKNAVTHLFQWPLSEQFQNLDLLQLLTLRWKPSFAAERRTPGEVDGNTAQAAERNGEALHAILEKCQESLEVLDMGHGFLGIPIVYPDIDEAAPLLPRLRELRVCGYIRTEPFAEWLGNMPNLESLTLSNCSLGDTDLLDDEGSDHWKDVFEAVRNHPNRMMVRYKNLESAAGSVLGSFQHHTGSEVDEYPVSLDENLTPFQRDLALYLTQKSDWHDDLGIIVD